jgi:uncharacterized membrane protein YphA (DoxX/SURF4 family)
LQRWYTKFPSGRPGAGLLILRIALGSKLLLEGSASLLGSHGPDLLIALLGALTIGAGACFVLGLLTPLVAGISALGETVVYLWHPVWAASFPDFSSLETIAVAIAIALLGPGALSLDAYFFGRRKVVIARIVKS